MRVSHYVTRLNPFTKFLLLLLYILLPLVAYSLGIHYQQGIEFSLKQQIVQAATLPSVQQLAP